MAAIPSDVLEPLNRAIDYAKRHRSATTSPNLYLEWGEVITILTDARTRALSLLESGPAVIEGQVPEAEPACL